MKITVKQLKTLIKEQIEEAWQDMGGDYPVEKSDGPLYGTFSLTIELGNDKMNYKRHIMHALRTLNLSGYSQNIMDTNGNKVGFWKIED